MMEKIEMQRKIFTAEAVLMLLSAVSLAVVVPVILLDTSPGSLPIQAASGAFIGMGIHLYLAYWFGIRLKRRTPKINKGVYIFSAFGLFILGFMIMDGAYAFLDDLRFVSIGMFICVFGDFAAALVSVIALFLLKSKS